ncbi:AraC family transcriptional regulator [Flavobacterium noncentrifugens]|uniref:Helix-turn-helix domain-containing protein n=1 Tax=Flavobacterium noncentrifugens TaxID=1128970 RepID=A0A1G8VU27_9FLAO|nr:AraC family transcriptional regulator [Flavobacterium noncentrifugens]GEP50645.1 AraC family transcriptional regulator [Flavobacterium noncentrifugens]SDJ69337.1 Helix-turn-helix domain-containing protein [Flavobacterium noncentrifugens]
MKNSAKLPSTFHSISELHRALGLPKPFHPLVSLVNYGDISVAPSALPTSLILDFYKISYKINLHGKIKYGQHHYDFDEGGLSFISPNQIIAASEDEKDYSGYTLLFHPDFIRSYALGKSIKNFGFFSYSANEALHLSESEKTIIVGIFENIIRELSASIDHFSQDLIASQIELLLKYSDRFYNRQFITRKIGNHDLLSNLEQVLLDYFADEKPLTSGLPTVQYLSDELRVSPRYLSDMLRSLTGQNAQQHIHSKVIEKAKDYLSTGNLSVSEIAYQLGFEHPQSFSKIFKRKTSLTPVEFKQSFN